MQIRYIASWADRDVVIWRGPTLSEYNQTIARLDHEAEMRVYLDLYEKIMVEGPPVHEVSPGIVDYVCRSVLENNPFNGSYEDVSRALKYTRSRQTYLESMKAILGTLFHYKLEEIEQWDADTFFDRLAKAELVSDKDLSPVDPRPKKKNAPNEPPPQRERRPLTRAQQMVLEKTGRLAPGQTQLPLRDPVKMRT